MDLTKLSEYMRGNLATVGLVALTFSFTLWGFVSLATFMGQGGFGQKPLPANLQFTQPSFATLSTQYSLSFKKDALKKLPSKVTTYKVQIGFDADALATVGKLLGLSGTVNSEGGNLTLKQDNKTLTYHQTSNQLIYSFEGATNASGFAEEQLKKQALDFIKKLNLVPGELVVDQINYFGDGLEPQVVKQDRAATAVVIAHSEIEGAGLLETIIITFTSSGTVLNFSLYPLEIRETEGSYQLKKFTEIEADVKAKNVQVVSFGLESDALETGTTIKQATFGSIKLGYSTQTKSALLQPVLILSGEAEVGDRQTNIEAVVPAIAGVRIDP